MNCKKGDKAVIFKGFCNIGHFDQMIGHVFECKEVVKVPANRGVIGTFGLQLVDCWVFETPFELKCGCGYMWGVPDECCKPLPGESDVLEFDKEKELTPDAPVTA